MDRIVLPEVIGMQKLAIERAFRGHQNVRVASVNKAILESTGIHRFVQDAMLLMVDVDHYDGKIDVLVDGIRRDPANPQLPIILLSAAPKKDLVLKAAGYRQTDILVKPFSDTELLEKVLKHRPSPQWKDIQERTPDENASRAEALTLTWNENYCTGIAQIDEEHKGIVDNFEKLYTMMRSGRGHEYYAELLIFLKHYVDSHFLHEENLQREIGYARLEEHIAAHAQFKAEVTQIIQEREGKTVTNLDLIRLNLFIKEWLIHHILMEDKMIGLSLQEPRQS